MRIVWAMVRRMVWIIVVWRMLIPAAKYVEVGVFAELLA